MDCHRLKSPLQLCEGRPSRLACPVALHCAVLFHWIVNIFATSDHKTPAKIHKLNVSKVEPNLPIWPLVARLTACISTFALYFTDHPAIQRQCFHHCAGNPGDLHSSTLTFALAIWACICPATRSEAFLHISFKSICRSMLQRSSPPQFRKMTNNMFSGRPTSEQGCRAHETAACCCQCLCLVVLSMHPLRIHMNV